MYCETDLRCWMLGDTNAVEIGPRVSEVMTAPMSPILRSTPPSAGERILDSIQLESAQYKDFDRIRCLKQCLRKNDSNKRFTLKVHLFRIITLFTDMDRYSPLAYLPVEVPDIVSSMCEVSFDGFLIVVRDGDECVVCLNVAMQA